MSKKLFCLVLHSHIPFVLAHGSWPHGMDWLYEAAAESYLPLLRVFRRLQEDGLRPGVSISFTPVLMEQLKSPAFAAGFQDYLRMKIEIARNDRREFERTGKVGFDALTVYWEEWYERLADFFLTDCAGDIIAAFRELQDESQVEVLTSAATHGYLPLLCQDESVRDQVRQGVHVYQKHFGRRPLGFWLPECAYRPRYRWKSPLGAGIDAERAGVDEILGQEGLGCFFVDTHLLKGGEAKGVYLERFPALKLLWEKYKKEYRPEQEIGRSPYQPYLAYPSNVPFLVRDEKSGTQVWSGRTGYPGDGWYLEFHKKHFPGGMRYWRITSNTADLGAKLPYEPEKTIERLEENADHFVASVLESLRGEDHGAVVSLYDTELFGHWWFEGPDWLELVLRKLAGTELRPGTAKECLDSLPAHQVISLPEGSWGKGGFHWIWLNDDTAWIWERIYRVEKEASRLRERSYRTNIRLLRQFVREKFLLESSDWPFLISTWTARDYAENRAAEHYERAATLAEWLFRADDLRPEETRLLEAWEEEDKVFSEVVAPDGHLI